MPGEVGGWKQKAPNGLDAFVMKFKFSCIRRGEDATPKNMESGMEALPEILAGTHDSAEMAARCIGGNDRVAVLVALRQVLEGIDRAEDVVRQWWEAARRSG